MKNKRPVLITVLCILGFIGVPLSILGVLFNMMSGVGFVPLGNVMPLWYSIFSIVWAIFYLFAVILIWKMKKIGVITYTALGIIEFIVGFTAGFASILWGISFVIVLVLFFSQFKKMK
jgi:hypothetical protein